ncbi:MAG TPA: hypothetical protein VJ720_02615 [Chitinophaga sp.]|nr:hypothetical protein [Chitinophaga sp.]
MKIFTFILSIYVLLMTVIPCCSFDNCAADEPVSRHEEPKGICSPFFSCHNCSIPVVLEKTMQVEPATETTSPRYREYIETYLPGYTATCWNPPKA